MPFSIVDGQRDPVTKAYPAYRTIKSRYQIPNAQEREFEHCFPGITDQQTFSVFASNNSDNCKLPFVATDSCKVFTWLFLQLSSNRYRPTCLVDFSFLLSYKIVPFSLSHVILQHSVDCSIAIRENLPLFKILTNPYVICLTGIVQLDSSGVQADLLRIEQASRIRRVGCHSN